MNGQFHLDTREWQAAARQLFATSSRELPDFIKGQALKVASEALKRTKHANKAQIEAELGQIATRIKEYRIGTGTRKVIRGKRVLREDSLAARILAKRFQLTGKWGVKGNTMEQRAANLIAARARSINFIRSGWIPAIAFLSRQVRKKPRGVVTTRAGARQYGQPKGSAHATLGAHAGKFAVTVINRALNTLPKPPGRKGEPLAIGEAGLRAAFAEAVRDMRAEFARRMAPEFRRVSAR